MASVVSILDYKKQAEQPLLVLVGLHESEAASAAPDSVSVALARCANALTTARSRHISVAFVRRVKPPSSIAEPSAYPAWLKGFEPRRNDLVFDVLRPSCYSNDEFSRTMDHSNGNFVIAGLFAETTCLATAVEAHHRRHHFTYLSDASACADTGGVPAGMFHASISQVISLYGAVAESGEWNRGLPLGRKTR